MLNIRNARNSSGSCLQGYLKLDYDSLVEAVGAPHFGVNGDGKVNNEWKFYIEDQLVTIYDYKCNGAELKDYTWHIGGKSKYSLDALNDLLEFLDVDARAYSWR